MLGVNLYMASKYDHASYHSLHPMHYIYVSDYYHHNLTESEGGP
jgi:hypothetical protein